jgi:hypothetical protein
MEELYAPLRRVLPEQNVDIVQHFDVVADEPDSDPPPPRARLPLRPPPPKTYSYRLLSPS